jgi:sporulation protein YlmC with PRC-barrel domain
MAIFGREVLGSSVVDRTGALLGTLKDIHIDLNTGAISELVVVVEATVDASALPFEHSENTVKIPASAVARIANNIHLNQ